MAQQAYATVQPLPAKEPACIVPLRKEPAQAAGVQNLPLEYHGGSLIANVEVFTIFWGAAWRQPPLAELAGKLNEFFDFIVTSPLIDQLEEYSVPEFTIGHGSFAGTATVDLHLPALLPDDRVQQLLQQQIASQGNFPQPSPNTLYFIFLPPGVVSDLQGARSCLQQCGYHEAIDGRIFYALIPHATCQGCTRGFPLFESLTGVASHELCEAITDPNGDGWFTNPPNGSAGEEIGDLCSEGTKKVGGFTVQTEHSNRAGGCV